MSTNFGAISVLSEPPVGYSVLRADGTVYNFESGAWETLPATGVPAARQVRALTSYATSGPLANQQYSAVQTPVFLYSGAWLATFQLNSDGSIASQTDDYPCIPGLSNSGVLSVLSATPVGYSALRADGTIYNFGSGAWEALPATGVPTAQQVRALTSYAASGPLANQRYAIVPSPVFASSGIWLATFQLNSDGTIASQADNYSCIAGLSNSGVLSVLSATPVGYSALRADGTVYNFESGTWEALPATGVPAARQVRALTSYATSGPLANQQYAAVPAPVFLYSGAWLATFQLNSDGTIASQTDDYPCIPGLSNSGVLSVLSATPVGYSVLRADGTVYNFESGAWETLPATGVPTAQQVRALTSYAASGPLANQQYAIVPSPVFAKSGIWFATFWLNSDGTIASQANDYPCIPEVFNSYALDGDVVHLAGAEAITGVKTFSTLPTLGALTGVLKTAAGAIATATPGIDYVEPGGSITGTAGNVSGTVAVVNGGTGKTTSADAFNALSPIVALGDLIHGSGANTAARLAGNTSPNKQFLTQTGDGTSSAAPVWGQITQEDLPPTVVSSTNSYSNPPWLTSIPGSIVSGDIAGNSMGLNGSIKYGQITDLDSWGGSASITTLGTIAGKLSLASISDPVGPGTGALWNSSSQNVLSFTSAGLVVRAGGIVWQGLDSGTPVASTTSQKSILTGIGTSQGTLTIQPNSLQVGKLLTLDIFGSYSSTSSRPTIRFVITLGGEVIAQTSALRVPVGNTNSMWYLTCPAGFQVQAVGPSGKIIGRAILVGNGSTGFTSYATQTGPPGIGAATIDTTVPLTFDVLVQWSAASPSNSIRFLGGTLSIDG